MVKTNYMNPYSSISLWSNKRSSKNWMKKLFWQATDKATFTQSWPPMRKISCLLTSMFGLSIWNGNFQACDLMSKKFEDSIRKWLRNNPKNSIRFSIRRRLHPGLASCLFQLSKRSLTRSLKKATKKLRRILNNCLQTRTLIWLDEEQKSVKNWQKRKKKDMEKN